jgi:threonine dehydrogenase-like Zn-dependent dehydrogenase
LRLEALGISWIMEGEGQTRAYDLVVEATGSPRGFDSALELVRQEGMVVLKSRLPPLSGPPPPATSRCC